MHLVLGFDHQRDGSPAMFEETLSSRFETLHIVEFVVHIGCATLKVHNILDINAKLEHRIAINEEISWKK